MENKIKLTSDSTCDLTEELLEKSGVTLCPIAIILGDEERLDTVNIDAEGVLDFVERTGKLPKTAASSKEQYKKFFKKQAESGYSVIHFCISSKASSCYNNAVEAAKEVKGVYVIDSLALSGGQGLQIMKARDIIDEGKPVEEVVEEIKSITKKTQLSFVVDTLEFLQKGGRCSTLAAVSAKLLKIHPSIYNEVGELKVRKKYIGNMERCLTQYVTDLFAEFKNYDGKRAFITHSPSDKKLVDLVIKKAKELFSFEEIYETFAGSTVTSHCGQNTIGLLFLNK